MLARKKWLWVLIGVSVAIGALYGVRECFRHFVYASFNYCVEAEFAAFPPDDKQLCSWTKSQPGVVSHTVSVCRVGAERKTLRIMFVQVRNTAGDPPFPDFEGRCGDLEYRGGGKFSDSADRECSCIPCE